MKKSESSFTLIELIVVMLILAIVSLLLVGNFISSLAKGRDSKRKSDLSQLRQALEMYYEDNRSYPPQISLLTQEAPKETYINKNRIFVVNGKTYVNKLPSDPNATYEYVYLTDANGTYYRMLSCIENTNDKGEGVSQTGFFGSPVCGACGNCKYSIYSPNITPLPNL